MRFPLRRSVIHRGDSGWDSHDVTVRSGQMPLFRERFCDVRVHRHLCLIYEIFGHKKTSGLG